MTKTKTKQRMTHPTGQQDSRDWIFCFVRTLGWQNSTPCFVWRNTVSTKTKWVPFGETGYMEWFDGMENILTPYVIMKGHEMVISNLFLLIHHGKPYIWRDLIGCKTFSYVVIIILFLLYWEKVIVYCMGVVHHMIDHRMVPGTVCDLVLEWVGWQRPYGYVWSVE